MMVVAVVAFGQKFETSAAFAEMASLYHPHFFQQVHGAIDRRQVAISLGQGAKNVADAQRMGFAVEDLQNGLAGAGDLAGLAAETVGEGGQLMGPVRMTRSI